MVRRHRNLRGREVLGPTPCSVAVIASTRSVDPDFFIHLTQRYDTLDFLSRQGLRKQGHQVAVETFMNNSEKRRQRHEVEEKEVKFWAAQESFLETRREKLRKMLKDEDEAFAAKVLAMKETPIERDARLREQVKQIRAKNLAKRMQLVQEKLDEKFLKDCDPARSLESERLKKDVAKDCQEMVAGKKQQQEQERKEKELFAEWMEGDYQIKTARFEAEIAQTRLKRIEMDEGLLKQIDANNAQEAILAEDKMADARMNKENDRYQREIDFFDRRMKEENQYSMRTALDKQLALKSRIKKQFDEEENASIAQLYERADQEAKAIITDERQNKADYAREFKIYMDYARQHTVEEKERERQLERELREIIYEKGAIQDEKSRLERMERKQQCRQTLAVRQRQMLDREEEKLQEKRESQKLHSSIKAQVEREQKLYDDSVIKKRQVAVKFRQDLEQQIAYKTEQQRQARLRQQDELEAQAVAEEQYQRKVEEILSRPPPANKHPFRDAMNNTQ